LKDHQKGSRATVQSVAGDIDAQLLPAPTKSADFTEIFRQDYPLLAGYCAGLVGDGELGGDLAQEAMARTWGRWSAVRDPHAYAFLVATNLARKAWKDRQRQDTVKARLAGNAGPPYLAPDHSMLDLIDRLPEKLRVPVLLHYYADLPIERVARLLRRPAGTIRQRLHEARGLLANMLREG
jgi:RNA polymerase sigma-70 factor (ECF subfamily)